MHRREMLVVILTWATASAAWADKPLEIGTPLSPPTWALLQRELLRAHVPACREFYQRYFDDRGWLQCVERWGGDDGPDDAIENLMDWPILHALGACDSIRQMYRKAWEGHLVQYTKARTVQVPLAHDGMYYKEFPVMFDWLHNAEGLVVFNLWGLSDPNDPRFHQRARRYAGFYLNEDPGAPNYDPKHRLIKSLFNGSRGPLLRKATALDWAGDPIEVANRFKPQHGETSYQEMLAHFQEYTDIIGDHPLNLRTTTLALNAYMLDHEDKYRKWILEYVDAWRERMIANNNIIPSNIGLDGTIGGAVGGRWWGGVYGWGFSVKMSHTGQIAHLNLTARGFQGFMNAYLLTGDDRYLEPWRRQIDTINAQKKTIDGREQYPDMYGAQGWYHFTPQKYDKNAKEIYYLSMKADDRARCGPDPWLDYLEGKNPDYPEQALRRDLDHLRRQVEAIRRDTSTPDTRLSDDSMRLNPASVTSLIELMLGGLPPGRSGSVLFCRLRYFDPERRRAGLPDDVAALLDRLTADQTAVTLVNVNAAEPRTVIIQAGAYAEHRFTGLRLNDQEVPLQGPTCTVRLAPGAGARLVFTMQRYVQQPTLSFPWDR
ncbi:MAG: hypothetical protein NZ700_03325 [Gemmataceae bacterium]|nr:hypothetical protein [Gemmataceae bacterium]MDW8267081.1 hypothetical protein [Gemmataceae bacterium]